MEVRTEQMQFEQLPALASEVARVETIREYAGEYRSIEFLQITFLLCLRF